MVSFGQVIIDEEMIQLAERFLVRCVCKDVSITTFDQLRNEVYYKKSGEMDLEKFPPTSSSILLHIKRAFFQTSTWIHSPVEATTLNPLDYGYEMDSVDDEVIRPKIVQSILPEGFSMPCKCGKCARGNICPCRVNSLKCCEYCSCKETVCQNPY